MYIKQVELTNIRGFHGRRRLKLDLTRPDGSHAGWTVIAGRNGSGKTTLLRGIALAVAGSRTAMKLTDGFGDWVSQGAKGGTAKAVVVSSPRWDEYYDVSSEAGERGTTTTDASPAEFPLGLSWMMPVVRGRALEPVLDDIVAEATADHAADGPWSGAGGWLCAGYGPFRRLLGGASEVQRLMQSGGPVSRLASLFHEDASLAEGISWLIEQHLRALERREGARDLKETALRLLGSADLLPDGYRVDDVDSEGLWVLHGRQRLPLRELSDGYRTVAALVVDILKQIYAAYGELVVDHAGGSVTVRQPGVVLIDEVDAHLHVSWQQRIGPWLKTHFPDIQFIVTTHSPYVCQAADPGGLIRLPGPDEQRAAERVSDELYQRVVYGSGEDAVLSDLFGLDSPYSQRAEQLRARLTDLEFRVIEDVATAEERAEHTELRRTLLSSLATRAEELDELARSPRAEAP
jgi:hypothetical protein